MNQSSKKPVTIQEVFIPSEIQKALLHSSLLQTDNQLYVEQLHLSVDGDFDVASLEKAWQLLIKRHSSLRSAFVWEGQSDIRQVVLSDVASGINRKRLIPGNTAQIDDQIRAFIEEDGRTGFKLDSAPLARVSILEESDDTRHIVISMHHAIMDGWSFTILFAEMTVAYLAYQAGRQPELPAATGYESYIKWLKTQDFGKSEQFWKNMLAPVESGTIFPRTLAPQTPPLQPYEHIVDAFSESESLRLQQFCKARHLTSNILVSAAWMVVLHVYCSQAVTTFGSAHSIRPLELPGSQSIVGPMINTIPVTARIERQRDIASFLEAFRSVMVDYQVHSQLSLGRILTLLPDHSELRGEEPLFESLLISDSFTHAAADENAGSNDIRVAAHETPERVPYPVTVKCDLRDLRISFHANRIDPAFASDMMRYLKSVLLYMEKHPETTIGELVRSLADFHPRLAGEKVQTGSTLCEHIHHNAARYPEVIAIRDENRSVTYRELSELIKRQAKNLGATANEIVGVSMRRGLPAFVSMLAIMECGACYLPLDPSYPSERLRFMAEDAKAGVIIFDGDNAAARFTDDASIEWIAYQTLLLSPSSVDETIPLRRSPDDNDPAYIIYTSGSTGQPKGAINSYRNVRTFMLLCDRLIPGHHETVLQFASLNFDVSLLETGMSAVKGGTLCILPDERKSSTDLVNEYIRKEGIENACLPPVVAATVVPDAVPSLKTLMTVGEPCPPAAARQWGKERKFFNLYGPTEAAIITLTNAVHETGHNSAIGVPVANVDVSILDGDGIVQPAGVPGELWLHGASVGSGYLNRPDANARAYVFGGYLTGDDCFIGADKLVHFIGRKDHQIQIRGYRVELGEIEHALCRVLKAKEAIVLAQEDPRHGPSLHAFVRTTEGSPQEREVKSELGNYLPSHMIPSTIAFVEHWPLNRNLKIDRKTLRQRITERNDLHAFAPCATPAEQTIAAIFSEQFNVAAGEIGRDFDFFAHRGQSLLAAATALQLRKQFKQPDIPLDIIYRHPILSDLAEYLDSRNANPGQTKSPQQTAEKQNEQCIASL